MKFIRISARCVAVMVVLCACSAPLGAGEVEDLLSEAEAAWKAGRFSEAAESVEFARSLVLQEKSAVLASFLPKPRPGWEIQAREQGNQEGATAVLVYSRGGSAIAVKITTDKAKEERMPFAEESPCEKMWREERAKLPVIDIKGHKALDDFEEKARRGSFSIEEDGLSIEIAGQGVTKAELLEVARSIDIDAIVRMK